MDNLNASASGVIEGFYGRPWSAPQRQRMIEWLHEAGLNTYFYAPKDDLKHRALWRQPYDSQELASLGALATACRTRGIRFCYAIAPGLDMRYRDEIALLQAKLKQLLEVGVSSFAILFDDIPEKLDAKDAEVFLTFARAHVHISNAVLKWLRTSGPEAELWFCPTIYCGRFAHHDVPGNAYLQEVGALLDPRIEVMWTGPEIVPETIPVDSIREVSAVLRRPPIIWDNLHANDYDVRRLFLGPFAGRPIELKAEVRGILLNPNSDFEANFVPLQTLGAYYRAGAEWDVDAARRAACERWLPRFASQTSRQCALSDVELLVDLFHLPFSAGPRLEQFIRDFEYLIHTPARAWDDRARRFNATADEIMALFEKLTELQDRELSFTFYRLMWEIKAEVKLMRGYLQLLQTNPPKGATFTPPYHHDPRIYRGGVVARLQRLMEMVGPGQFRAAPMTAI